MHRGKKPENPETAETVFKWIMEQPVNELSVSTLIVVLEANGDL